MSKVENFIFYFIVRACGCVNGEFALEKKAKINSVQFPLN